MFLPKFPKANRYSKTEHKDVVISVSEKTPKKIWALAAVMAQKKTGTYKALALYRFGPLVSFGVSMLTETVTPPRRRIRFALTCASNPIINNN